MGISKKVVELNTENQAQMAVLTPAEIMAKYELEAANHRYTPVLISDVRFRLSANLDATISTLESRGLGNGVSQTGETIFVKFGIGKQNRFIDLGFPGVKRDKPEFSQPSYEGALALCKDVKASVEAGNFDEKLQAWLDAQRAKFQIKELA
jgi:hypothetical protein